MAAKKLNNKTDINIIWDDNLLISAYDSSMKLKKEELAKRLAAAKNKNIEALEEDAVENSNSESEVESETDLHPQDTNFVVGSYVRANYTDGVDYEAEIISINGETGLCHIKYLGYGNEDDVNMSDLLPTWGKKVREKQVQAALEENCSYEETTQEQTADVEDAHKLFGDSIPAPPVMPPIQHLIDSSSGEEDYEHLAAMLKSWYLSGYYTGVYQGVRMTKEKMKKDKK